MNPTRQTALLALSIAIFVGLALMPPIAQDLAFHAFADQRTFLGIPNFWNVVSNLPFAAIGLMGCRWLLRAANVTRAFAEPWERNAYFVFFFAEILTCFGSAYYHASPTNQTLVWDRTVFILLVAAFFRIVVTEFISNRVGRWLLAPVILLGLFSVLYWRQTGDLRLYLLVQFYPVLAALLTFLLFRSLYTHNGALVLAWSLFVLAKLCEYFDWGIYRMTGFWSGHTLKHLIAAAATYALLRGLQHRLVRRKDTFEIGGLTACSPS